MTTNLTHRKNLRRSRRRGFTLTEIAIVLGIIGLILGSIWVAAGAVYNNLRVSRAETELLAIAQAVRTLYATSTSTGDAPGTDETASFCAASIFPSDMVSSGGCANALIDPWNAGVSTTSQKITINGDAFGIEFDGVPQGACIVMLTAATGEGRDPGLFYAAASKTALGAGSMGSTASTFPLSAATATADCANSGNATNSVQFMFELKG